MLFAFGTCCVLWLQTVKHLFVPAERRIPRIRIETRQAHTLKGQRIVVAIDSWPRTSRYPLVRYTCICDFSCTVDYVAILAPYYWLDEKKKHLATLFIVAVMQWCDAGSLCEASWSSWRQAGREWTTAARTWHPTCKLLRGCLVLPSYIALDNSSRGQTFQPIVVCVPYCFVIVNKSFWFEIFFLNLINLCIGRS